MNRSDLQKLSDLRLRDAEVLLGSGRYAAAFYLTGYIVECALKACIAKKIRQYEFPDRKLTRDAFTHNLRDLVRVARLEALLEKRRREDDAFDLNWTLVQEWSEEARYEEWTNDEQIATDLFTAVADEQHGVFAWIRQHW